MPSLSLLEKFRQNFSPELIAQVQDQDVAAQGWELALAGEDRLEACLPSEDLECELRLQERRLISRCSCPQPWPCLHLAELLRLADERELLQAALKKNVAMKMPSPDSPASPGAAQGKASHPAGELILMPASGPRSKKPLFREELPLISAEQGPSRRTAAAPIAVQARADLPIEILFVLRNDTTAERLLIELFWRSTGPDRRVGPLDLRPGLEIPPQAAAILETARRLDLAPDRHQGLSRIVIPHQGGPLLRAMAATGKLYWRADAQQSHLQRLRCRSGRLQLRGIQTAPGSYMLSGLVQTTSEDDQPPALLRLAQSCPHAPHGLWLQGGEAVFYEPEGALALELFLRKHDVVPLVDADLESFARNFLLATTLDLSQLPGPFRLARLERGQLPWRGRLYFGTAAFKIAGREMLQADLRFLYGQSEIARLDPAPEVLDTASGSICPRDLRGEQDYAAWLQSLQLRWIESGPEPGFKLPPAALPELVRAVIAQGGEVLAEGRSVRLPKDLAITISASGMDWLQAQGEGSCEGGGKVRLPDILQAIERGERFVILDDGTLGLLPEEWLKHCTALTDLGELSLDGLRFMRAQALLIRKLAQELPCVDFADEQSQSLEQRLLDFASLHPSLPEPGFQAQLRPYQQQGLAWLELLQRLEMGGILADDMGLGKTVQILAWLQRLLRQTARSGDQPVPEAAGPILIIAPSSLLFNWQAETARFAPELAVTILSGSARHQHYRAGELSHINLISYGTLLRDTQELRQIRWMAIIADEAQVMKNPQALTSQAIRLLSARHRLALSGTPVENNLGDLWSLFAFTNPGLLGSYQAFSQLYMGSRQQEGAMRALQSTIRPLMLRRTKEQVASDLPAKQEITLYCQMPPEQQQVYDELSSYYRSLQSLSEERQEHPEHAAPLSESSPGFILGALTRLRQASCHAGLIHPERRQTPSGKLETLLERLEELRLTGHKALVFSQFTSFLDIVQEELASRGHKFVRLDGSTQDRSIPVRRFQEDPAVSSFLISLKAGGTGLNLTAASYVFLLDPWWNLAAEAQAVDRAYRIGQSRQVTAIRLVSVGTLEEKLLTLKARKAALAEYIAQGATSGELSRADLLALLE